MLPIIITKTFMTIKNSQPVQTQNQSLLILHGHRFYVCLGGEETRGGNERRGWSQEEEVKELIEGRIYLLKTIIALLPKNFYGIPPIQLTDGEG